MSNIHLSLQRQCIRTMIIVFITVIFSASLQAQFRFSKVKPEVIEYTISSRILNEERKITIYKPSVHPEYAEAVSPIVYTLDGDYMSVYTTAILNFLCDRFVQLPPVTVVNIENSHNSSIGRNRDLTPIVAKDSSRYKTSGGAGNFLRFIKEELLPFVEKDYKKTPYRLIVGNSLGGFFAIYAFLEHPEIFNAYIASSTAMWMDGSIYMKTVEEIIGKANARNSHLFFSVANETSLQPDARKLDSLLQKKNLQGLSYQFHEYPDETHATVFLKAFYDGIRYIFYLDPPDAGKTPEEIYSLVEDQYRARSKIFGYNMSIEEVINNYGYNFIEKDIDKALKFFKWNVEKYPNSANVYDSYGEALLKKGDKKNAMLNYEKAFQMDPTNTAARDIVNKLKSEQ